MSSLAFPREAAPRRTTHRGLPAVFSQRGSDVLLAVAMMALAATLLVSLPGAFNVDSWLALVAGRAVWQNGIPHHETLTVIAQGTSWIDQQWLSQLATYGLYLLGGLSLVGIAGVTLFASSVAAAVAGARRLGASLRSMLLVLPFCLVLIAPRHEVRTQEFAMPLFVALVYLLARDSRAPSRRVYWCLPILVLWANLHGTVMLGAMLVALRGLTVAWQRRRGLAHSLHAWKRPLALIVGAPLSLLITPYGLAILGYYRTTMLGSTLRQAVTEWQPITSSPVTAAVFCLAAAIAVWSLGRHASRTSPWEKLAFLALAAGSILVVRNVLFFGLFALMIMPLSVAIGSRASERPAGRIGTRINALLGGAALATLLIAMVATLTAPASAVELQFQRTGVLTAVQRATRSDPSLRVLAEDRFADWLLWRDPALSGRVANDVRFELLTSAQIDRLENVFGVLGPDWKLGAKGYRLLVLDQKYDAKAVQAFLHEPGSQVLYTDGERIVILRSASQAGTNLTTVSRSPARAHEVTNA